MSAVAEARTIVEKHADNPSAFLALNSGNEYFTAPGLDGVVVYREAGRHFVQFAGPFAAEADYSALLEKFIEHAKQSRRRIVSIQLQRADAEIYARHGFVVNQLGASYAVDLAQFTLRGSKFMRLRNKVSRALRAGVVVSEEDPATAEPDLQAVDQDWLRGKGKHVKPLRFLVGERDGETGRRLFVARQDEVVIGYITYSPVYGSRSGWMHDLSRRRTDVPPGVMEAVNVAAIETFTAEGAGWLHFGFTPFSGLDPAHDVDGASPMVRRLVKLLADHGSAVYPAATQVAYKEKWYPHAVLPEYVAFAKRPRLSAVWQLLRVTNSI